MATTRVKWLGAFSQSDERDTVGSKEYATLNSTIKDIEDTGSTVTSIDSHKGGVLITYTTP